MIIIAKADSRRWQQIPPQPRLLFPWARHRPEPLKPPWQANTQYGAFLNAVDSAGTNPYGLWNSLAGTDAQGGIARDLQAAAGSRYATRANMADKPVTFVSWFDAARFANWVHNGQGGAGIPFF
jgi:hypothetical protein